MDRLTSSAIRRGGNSPVKASSLVKVRGVPSTAAVQRRISRHRIEAIELRAHAAVHDELVQAVLAAGRRKSRLDVGTIE
jgi:hypothetical protein